MDHGDVKPANIIVDDEYNIKGLNMLTFACLFATTNSFTQHYRLGHSKKSSARQSRWTSPFPVGGVELTESTE